MAGSAGPPADARWRGFRVVWAATGVSNLADGILLAATPLVAVTLTRDPLAVTAITAVQHLPWLLFAMPLGVLVDRADQVRLMRTASGLRATAVALLALTLLVGDLHIAVLYLAALAVGTAETLYDSTSSAVVPAMVPDVSLDAAHSRVHSTQTVANGFAGPPLGGALFAVAAAAPFVVGAAGYVVALVLLVRLRFPGGVRTRSGSTFRGDLVAGVKALAQSPVLVALCALFAVGNLVSSGTDALLVLTVIERMGGQSTTYGLVLAGGAVGAFLGGIYGARIAAVTSPGIVIAATTVASGLATASIALLGHPAALSAAMAVDGFVVLVQTVVVSGLRARLIPHELLGRVVAAFRTISTGAAVVGALAGGVVARLTDLRLPFVLGGLTLVLVTPVAMIWLRDSRIDQALLVRGSPPHCP